MTTQRPVVGGLGTTLPELQAEMFRVLTSQRKSAMRIRLAHRAVRLWGKVVSSIFVVALVGAVTVCPLCSAGDKPTQLAAVDYLSQIKPVFRQHCYSCHGLRSQKGGLRVDTVAHLLKGGSRGPAIVPGKSQASLLLRVLRGQEEDPPRMPLGKEPLSAEQIALIARWIDQGAPFPKDETPDDGRSHWAFRPPVRPPIPSVRNPLWVRNPIDAFILARLEAEGISPSPPADKVTLIRRVYLDLIGLPPSPAEVDAFVADNRPDAYEQLVERLLSSPHYGERWARHWLDVARYADTHGYTIDGPREMWKYRDWVIEAFNRDMPYDQFLTEQMAGDLLPDATVEQKIATGFHRNTMINQEGGIDPEQFRVEAVADRIHTIGVGILGLTLNCARCHDHKYDPISQREYFQLFAFFNNQDEPTITLAEPELVAKQQAIQAKLREAVQQAEAAQKAWLKRLSDSEREKLPRHIQVILNLGFEQRDRRQKETLLQFVRDRDEAFYRALATLAELEAQMPKLPTAMILQERKTPRETRIHIQGDFTRPGERVEPGVPKVLNPLPDSPRLRAGKPNRLDFAAWLVAPDNPLTARVMVNRIWQHYFGKGLVETENDFGLQGSPPSHPELLDWLAVEFRESGWRLKHLHRLIVTSATYRQSSQARPELAEKDPNNRLLARQNRLRLEAEYIRDSALAVSGKLERRIGGPSVYPPQPDGVYSFTQVPRQWPTSSGPDRFRRGLYTWLQRSAPYPALIVFDAPDGTSSCTRRVRSNTPLQALTLLNDPAYFELAQAFGERIVREAPAEDDKRIAYAFRLALCRSPSDAEMRLLRDFVGKQRAALRNQVQEIRRLAPHAPAELALDQAVFTLLGRALMNLDEFITRE
jgi:mono/diheme cytochrome c family protein